MKPSYAGGGCRPTKKRPLGTSLNSQVRDAKKPTKKR